MIAKDCKWSVERRSFGQNEKSIGRIVIEGIQTTIPFHIKFMDDPGFNWYFTTKYLESFDFSDLQTKGLKQAFFILLQSLHKAVGPSFPYFLIRASFKNL